MAAIDLELRRAGLALEDLRRRAPAAARAASAGEVELGALLARGRCGLASRWRAPGAALVVEPPAGAGWSAATALRLAQAFANLVANAIEHGGGEVRVRARAAPGGGVRIEVTDGGPGSRRPLAELVAGRAAGGASAAATGWRSRPGSRAATAAGWRRRRRRAAPGSRSSCRAPSARPARRAR